MSRVNFPENTGILGIGVDCEEISRFEKMDSMLMEKIFTKGEREYCIGKANPSQHFAARFAGKEAVMKCFGSSGKKIAFNQIEILKCENGAPVVNILDRNLGDYDARLSLSHSGNMAIAFAVIFKSRRGI
jgi:holo-[acyl-carrier protein] synthase